MTLTEFLASPLADEALRIANANRTVSEAETNRRIALHDLDDLRPEERRSYETGSIPKVTL